VAVRARGASHRYHARSCAYLPAAESDQGRFDRRTRGVASHSSRVAPHASGVASHTRRAALPTVAARPGTNPVALVRPTEGLNAYSRQGPHDNLSSMSNPVISGTVRL